MAERADQLHHDNAPAHSTTLVQAFWQSTTSPRSVRPLQPRFRSLRLLDFHKAKFAVERQEICDTTVTQYTNSFNGVSLPTDYPHGTVTVHGCTVKFPQGHVTDSRDIKNGWILSGQPSCTFL